ncbi:hypothetical protein D5F01_LYC09651 [Larimichthys crocea]|uniref:Uncharacterized protein n=1 Tax=Larimichthys crocea TaxID=215358 RepID=A0A6G0ILN0_LARCR|nr:hypothetical protein D5F01_LYC09651 [Larimichthys crocea]
MPQLNYDHIQTVEDLKNEVLSLQQRNNIRKQEIESLQQENTSLKRDQKTLIQKNEDVETQNNKMIQRLKDMEINHRDMRQQLHCMHRNIQQLKTQVATEHFTEERQAIEFQMGLHNTLDKIYAKFLAKKKEAEEVKKELNIVVKENCHVAAMLIKDLGDMVNKQKMQQHKQKTHWGVVENEGFRRPKKWFLDWIGSD